MLITDLLEELFPVFLEHLLPGENKLWYLPKEGNVMRKDQVKCLGLLWMKSWKLAVCLLGFFCPNLVLCTFRELCSSQISYKNFEE